jgi:putative membrane protein
VYNVGVEPDYRFSFANERTFLAWIRTAMALIASGVAVDVLVLPERDPLARSLAVLLAALGMAAAVISGIRWARAEQAMRLKEPLPGFSSFVALPLGLAIAGVLLGALLW